MLKHLLTTASIAGAAYAASCSTSGTTTISNSADATGLGSCSTYSGSVALATGVSGQFDIPGVKSITGNLVAHNINQMSQLSASSLQNIGGDFDLLDVQVLNSLSFPYLTQVGSIKWSGLPTLSNVQFGSGLRKAPHIDIQNTGLSKLDSIFPPNMDTIFIANNGMLQTLDFKIANISDSLNLLSNGNRLIVSFPNLEWAQNLTIRDAANVSLPLLSEIRGSIGFYENSFTSLSAPNLTSVAHSFAIVKNNALTNTSFPKLTTVKGGFQISNNTKLSSISGFPKLTNVGGAFDCNGAFDEVDVPSLSSVSGAFNLQSSEDIESICDNFKKTRSENSSFIRGDFVCAGKLETPSGEGTKPGKTTDGSDSGASSGTVSIAIVGMSTLATLFLAFL